MFGNKVLPDRLSGGAGSSAGAGSGAGSGVACGDDGGVSKVSSAAVGDGGGEGVGVGRSGAVVAGTGGDGGCDSLDGGEGPGSVGVTEEN